MIRKVVQKYRRDDPDAGRRDLDYWLSRPPDERLAAVDFLRAQAHGRAVRLRRLLACFNDHGVEYLVVGGYALAYHGAPRYTGDLDLYVRPTAENAGRILAALADFGFGDVDLAEDDFTRPDNVVQLGLPPIRIDIVTSLSGVTWDEAAASKEEAYYAEIPVSYIGREAFVANKRATGRRKDLADLEALGED